MEYDLSKTLTDVEELERARRVWVALTQSRSGTRRSTGWRRFVAPGDSIGMPARLNTYVERMGKCAERLHNVSIESRPATELILEMGKHRDVLIYADPPYLGSTRQSNYRYEMLGEEEHRELAEQLHDCEASVVLSGYASELYDTLYKDWDRVEFITTANSGAPRIEVLWSNSPLKVDLWGVEGERNE
jgi:DNA adenine methylase